MKVYSDVAISFDLETNNKFLKEIVKGINCPNIVLSDSLKDVLKNSSITFMKNEGVLYKWNRVEWCVEGTNYIDKVLLELKNNENNNYSFIKISDEDKSIDEIINWRIDDPFNLQLDLSIYSENENNNVDSNNIEFIIQSTNFDYVYTNKLLENNLKDK